MLDGNPIVIILQGSFTGTPEPSGFIEQADLSSFSANLIGLLNSFQLADLNLFSFLPGSMGSLDFFASHSLFGNTSELCSGAAAAFGLCGLGGNIAGELSFPSSLTYITTADAATVTLAPPQPLPESSGLVLVGLGIMAAGIGRVGLLQR